MGASGRAHQLVLRLITGVEDCEILFLLLDVRHTKVLAQYVRHQRRVVGLLRALDIDHVRVDLWLRHILRGLIRWVLCSKDLWLIHSLAKSVG